MGCCDRAAKANSTVRRYENGAWFKKCSCWDWHCALVCLCLSTPPAVSSWFMFCLLSPPANGSAHLSPSDPRRKLSRKPSKPTWRGQGVPQNWSDGLRDLDGFGIASNHVVAMGTSGWIHATHQGVHAAHCQASWSWCRCRGELPLLQASRRQGGGRSLQRTMGQLGMWLKDVTLPCRTFLDLGRIQKIHLVLEPKSKRTVPQHRKTAGTRLHLLQYLLLGDWFQVLLVKAPETNGWGMFEARFRDDHIDQWSSLEGAFPGFSAWCTLCFLWLFPIRQS